MCVIVHKNTRIHNDALPRFHETISDDRRALFDGVSRHGRQLAMRDMQFFSRLGETPAPFGGFERA